MKKTSLISTVLLGAVTIGAAQAADQGLEKCKSAISTQGTGD